MLWRQHFKRYPFDETPRLLAQLIATNATKADGGRIQDHDVRPYAYTSKQLDEFAKAEQKAKDEALSSKLIAATPYGKRQG